MRPISPPDRTPVVSAFGTPGPARRLKWGRILVAFVLAAAAVGGAVGAMPLVKTWWDVRAEVPETSVRPPEPPGPERLDADTIALPPEVVQTLGVRTAEVTAARRPRELPPLAGTLNLDSNRLARVHARFAGEVVALGTVVGGETAEDADTDSEGRPLRVGDHVRKGQLLAVIWSKELGEKKSELVEALARLRIDREQQERLRGLYERGGTAEKSLRDAEHAVELDLIAAGRAERTLRSWRLGDEEIAAVRAEAERLRKPGAARAADPHWARVEVRASHAGVIVEKNLHVGDMPDTTLDLFKVADLGRLTVWAHAYEEDLPSLQGLPRPIAWEVRLPSRPGFVSRGEMEQIGAVIDPNQRTALVSGHVDNAAGELRVGQSVTATVKLPPPEDEVEVPATAVVEDGRESLVFVQPSAGAARFVRRRVSVVRRFHDVIYLHARPPADGPARPVRPGERVVTGGALFLRDALEELPVRDGDRVGAMAQRAGVEGHQ